MQSIATPTARPLASLLPQCVTSWERLLRHALRTPLSSIHYPDHFRLQFNKTHTERMMQRSSSPSFTAGLHSSAVLVLLSPTQTSTDFQDMCLTLMERTQHVRLHKGQISFPGGGVESGETAVSAAQRETYEEVGVPEQEYCVLGQLREMTTLEGAHAITPVLALAPLSVHPYPASAAEVASTQFLHMSSILLHSSESHVRLRKQTRAPEGTVKDADRHCYGTTYYPAFVTSHAQNKPSPRVSSLRLNSSHGNPDDGSPTLHLSRNDLPGKLVWGLTSFIICELLGRLACALHNAVERTSPADINGSTCDNHAYRARSCRGSNDTCFLRCSNIVIDEDGPDP